MAVDVAEVTGSAQVEPVSAGTSPAPAPVAPTPQSAPDPWVADPTYADDPPETPPAQATDPAPAPEVQADPVPPVPPEPPTPQAPDLTALTPDALATYLSTLSHDDLAKIPAYNAQVQRGLAKAREEAERKVREEAAETERINQNYLGWHTYFAQEAQTGRLAQILATDKEKNEVYWKVKEWEQSGGVVNAQGVTRAQQAYGQKILDNLFGYFKKDPELSPHVGAKEDYYNLPDPAAMVHEIVKKATAAEREKIKTEIEAGVTAALAARHITLPTAASVNSVPVATATLTPQEYERRLLAGEISEDSPEAQAYWNS